MTKIQISSILLQIIIIILLIFIVFSKCDNSKLNHISNTQLKNQFLIEELDKKNNLLLDTIDYYMKKDGTIVNNYNTYIKQYEKDIKKFDTTNFNIYQLDSLFSNWKPE